MISSSQITDHYITNYQCPYLFNADPHSSSKPKEYNMDRNRGGSCVLFDNGFREETRSRAALFSKGLDHSCNVSGTILCRGGMMSSACTSVFDSHFESSVIDSRDCRGWSK